MKWLNNSSKNNALSVEMLSSITKKLSHNSVVNDFKCIVISTHILEEVDAVCTRAMIIASGKVVADASPEELKSQSGAGDLDEVFRKVTKNA